MAEEQDDGITFRDVCIGIGYIAAIALNVYLILDQVTDGESSRQLSMWWYQKRSAWRQSASLEEEFARTKPYVVWEAINIVEGTNNGH